MAQQIVVCAEPALFTANLHHIADAVGLRAVVDACDQELSLHWQTVLNETAESRWEAILSFQVVEDPVEYFCLDGRCCAFVGHGSTLIRGFVIVWFSRSDLKQPMARGFACKFLAQVELEVIPSP